MPKPTTSEEPCVHDPFYEAPNTPWPPYCTWCDERINGTPYAELFLYEVFGYLYCTKACRDAHVFSK